jgi:dynamin GTPase
MVNQVHRVLVEIVSATANATAGLGRYPPLRREVRLIPGALSLSKHSKKVLYLELLHFLVL